MNYFEIEQLKAQIAKTKEYREMQEAMQQEVANYFEAFTDSPEKVSRWGHYYFCQKDGGILIYNDKKPKEHVCSICGETYSDGLLNGVWVTMYRNQGAVNAWKSALLYRLTKDEKYLRYIVEYTSFYADHYEAFELHNKEGLHFESTDKMSWGSARIMPQSLNEAIFIIRLINALQMVKTDLSQEFLKNVEDRLFHKVYLILRPQVDKIHNISCWLNSAIGIMGLFLDRCDMKDFAFEGLFNINRQLKEGVTRDWFWYEGSIHYNFFTLEGVTNLLLFTRLYDYKFEAGYPVIEQMLKQAYHYAFDNHQLPNPNDGWPNINLKTYSHIYAIAAKIFGVDSEIGNMYKNIVDKAEIRGELPLSKPYYFNNDISLEELIFIPGIRDQGHRTIATASKNFSTSFCGIIKNHVFNVFYKYGHNGPSHAHPDKMNIEVIVKNKSLSRDLSNSGYGNSLCNEWHRVTASHNTVVVGGMDHPSVDGGDVLEATATAVKVQSRNVYPNVNFIRSIKLDDKALSDRFEVIYEEVSPDKEILGVQNICDYFFHVEGELRTMLELKDGNLGFTKNGYQHLYDVKQVMTTEETLDLIWELDDLKVTSTIYIGNKELYVAKTPDNPVTKHRTTFVLREKSSQPVFEVRWQI